MNLHEKKRATLGSLVSLLTTRKRSPAYAASTRARSSLADSAGEAAP
jgi:hypothetical protein